MSDNLYIIFIIIGFMKFIADPEAITTTPLQNDNNTGNKKIEPKPKVDTFLTKSDIISAIFSSL